MQIAEVRNDIIKITYSPYQNGVLLSDFMLISEGENSVLAQVIGIESSTEKDLNTAALKCCLSVDETGKIETYSGFIPSKGADVAPVSQEQVISMLADGENTINWGYLAQHENLLFKTEKEFLFNKPLILTDDYENYKVITANIVHINNKLGQKTVIVDFDGTINAENAFYVKLGEDFKLPLSYGTLNYIYENDLKSENISEQAVIQDVIVELQDYIKTLDSGYLPFSTIKEVICNQYEANKIPELAILKNKFMQYAQQEFLAETEDDFNSLNTSVEENNIVIIDASELDTVWHKLLLNYLSKEISTACTFICKLENDNSDKKTIINIYNNKIINPVIISNYMYDSVSTLKSVAKNMILFSPIQAVNDFPTYNSFIQKLNRDEYVIFGENTLYLNFIVKLAYLDSNMSPEYIEKEIRSDIDKFYSSAGAGAAAGADTSAVTTKVFEKEQETTAYTDEIITEEDLDFLDELTEMPEEIPPESETENDTTVEQETSQEEDFSLIEEDSQTETIEPTEQENIPQFEQEIEPQAEQIITEQAAETVEATNIIAPVENILLQTDTLPEEPAEKTIVEEPTAEEQIVKQVEMPIPQPQPIPVYSVPELEIDTPADFKEGNLVYHEKYGKGVIEKIMNYGKKTLCSIQFDDVGRRLLDPNLAGLKQL